MPLTNVGYNPLVVVHAGTPGVLVNRDLVNRVYVGTSVAIFDGNPAAASILDPLAAIPYDGMEDIYASTTAEGVSVYVDFLESALNWSPSALQVAEQLTENGIALNAGAVILSSPGNSTFTSGEQITLGPFPATQLSYEFGLRIQCLAGESLPFMTVNILMQDSASGLDLDSVNYYCAATNVGVNRYKICGPLIGDQFTVSLTWNGALSTNSNCRYVLSQTSRTLREYGKSVTAFSGIRGYLAPPVSDLDGGIIIIMNGGVPAGSDLQFALPLYSGNITIRATGLSGTLIQLSDIMQTQGLGSNVVYAATIPSSGLLVDTFTLPNGQCILTITNSAGVSDSVTLSIQPQLIATP